MYLFNPDLDKHQNKQVLIITGLSGAGKTSFMRALEDFDFYCVDNLPLPLVAPFLNLAFKAKTHLFKVALGIDARGQKFLKNFIQEVENIKNQNKEKMLFKIIFLNAEDNTLIKRFQETRRKHPLASRGVSLLNAVKREKEILEPIAMLADIKLDTDVFNIHDLRKWVKNSFTNQKDQEILVKLISFGFKYGIPLESNLVYDLRFLPNPHFVPELKKLDGRSEFIQSYLFEKDEVKDYWNRLNDFLNYSIQNFYKEGRFFANIAIGCTGGKHRSVAFAEKLGKEKYENVRFLVQHRDLGKE